jgi:hypothetical protein
VRKPLGHPLPLATVLLLAVNDHLLKARWPGLLTGKLSDFAGLFFFPLLLPLPPALSVLATGAVFTALKTWPAFNRVVSPLLGHNVLDPTDLWALTMLPLSWLWMHRAALPCVRPGLQRAAILAAGAASLATTVQPGHYERNMPLWTSDEVQWAGCARLRVNHSKSGKRGLGLDLEWNEFSDCEVLVRSASLRLRDRDLPAEVGPVRATGGLRDAWLAFPFDGDAAWNSGDREAVLTVEITAAGQPHTARFELAQHLDGDLVEWRDEPWTER